MSSTSSVERSSLDAAKSSAVFVWERAVRDDNRLSATAKHLALTIRTYASKEGVAFPGVKTLAKAMSVNARTVKRHLHGSERDGIRPLLIECRYLRVEWGGHRSGTNIYHLELDPSRWLTEESAGGKDTLSNRGDAVSKRGDVLSKGGGTMPSEVLLEGITDHINEGVNNRQRPGGAERHATARRLSRMSLEGIDVEAAEQRCLDPLLGQLDGQPGWDGGSELVFRRLAIACMPSDVEAAVGKVMRRIERNGITYTTEYGEPISEVVSYWFRALENDLGGIDRTDEWEQRRSED